MTDFQKEIVSLIFTIALGMICLFVGWIWGSEWSIKQMFGKKRRTEDE